jgi:hypothetical protein
MRHSAYSFLGLLWGACGGLQLMASIESTTAGMIQAINLGLITLGSTAILLYQRRQAALRDEYIKDRAAGLRATEQKNDDRAADIAAALAMQQKQQGVAAADTQNLLGALHDRLDAVILQRDKQAARADQMFDQLVELTGRIEKTRCVYPAADGAARCLGMEKPPCTA